jgi:hypothetical protein
MIVSCFITELRRFETVEVAAGVQSLDGLTTEVDFAAPVILVGEPSSTESTST